MVKANELDMVIGLEEDIYSDFSEDNMDLATSELEEMKETLSFIANNPININTATRNQLEELPFLKHSQIENLLEYIFDYGPLKSIYELSLVDGFDTSTIKYCIPFLKVDITNESKKFSLKNIFKYGKLHTTIYSGGFLQKKEGFNNNKYIGEPYSLYTKLYFKHHNLSFGFLGSKTEGEPFDFKYNKGFDFYSAHIFLSDVSKHIKKIVVGDYKVIFGQGLVFKSNNNFNNTSIENVIISSDNIKPSYSTSETGYYRGAALQIGGKNISFSLLSSFTFYNKNEGYHRTEKDFEKRYKTPSYIIGANLNYSFNYLKLGASGYFDFFDKWFNIGIDYRFRLGKFWFSGETAIDKNLKIATLNSITVNCNEYISISALMRYYQLGFKTKYGNAYTKNSVTDETGFYSGIDFTPFKNWKFQAYSDIYRISFIKTNISKPSVGFRFNIKAIYNPDENNLGYIRYVVYSKEKNIKYNDGLKGTGYIYKHNITINYKISEVKNFNFNATLAASIFSVDSLNGKKSNSCGFLISTYGSWRTKKGIFKITIGGAFFDIPYYDNTIYNYEPSVHYSYTSPQYYGIGTRIFFLIGLVPIKYMNIDLKLSNIHYVDRSEIGSGDEKIKGNNKTQITGVISFKF